MKRIACVAAMLNLALVLAAPAVPARSGHAPTLYYRYRLTFEGSETQPLFQGIRAYRAEYKISWKLDSHDAFLLTRTRSGDGRFNDGEYGHGKVTGYKGTAWWPAWDSESKSCEKYQAHYKPQREIRFEGSLNSPSTSHDGLTLFTSNVGDGRDIEYFRESISCFWKPTHEGEESDEVYDDLACCSPWNSALGMQAGLGLDGEGMYIFELLRFRIPKASFGSDFTITKGAVFVGLTGVRREYHYKLKFKACSDHGRDATNCPPLK